MAEFTLSIPFTIPVGMPKEILKTNIKYLLTTIHSFYRSGNDSPTKVWTNSQVVKASVERYAYKTKMPISVVFEDFQRFARWSSSKANSPRVTNRLLQFIGTHSIFGNDPFIHSEIDIVYLDKIMRPYKPIQFWGKTWQKKAVINQLSSETSSLFDHLGMDVPENPVWANTGLYYSSTDLSEYAQEVGSVLLNTDISSVVMNKPNEEIFQNIALWRGERDIGTDCIDYDADMNLVPSRVADIPVSVRMKSVHYTHGNRPHVLSTTTAEAIGKVDSDGFISATDFVMIWHYMVAEIDEILGGTIGTAYRKDELKPHVERFIGDTAIMV